MLALVVAFLLLYLVVRLAARHGHMDAEQSRLERERYGAFEQMIASGNLDAPASKEPDAP